MGKTGQTSDGTKLFGLRAQGLSWWKPRGEQPQSKELEKLEMTLKMLDTP